MRMEKELDHMLEGLEASNRESCKRHFMKIIETSIMRNQPDKYVRSLLMEMYTEMLGMRGDAKNFAMGMQTLLDEQQRRKQEACLHTRQERSENREAYFYREVNQTESKFYIPSWNLKYQDVQWEHGTKLRECKDDILMLTEAWSKERAAYPHWYIPPYEVCTELSSKTSEVGLLQCHTGIDIDTMFAFCYELVWSYEKSMNSYSDYEVRNIHQIWKAYGESLATWDKEELSSERGELLAKWFDVGMALLREYREAGMDSEWNTVYDTLKSYAQYRWRETRILQVEKVKQALFHMDIPAMRRCLGHCKLDKTDYELRL